MSDSESDTNENSRMGEVTSIGERHLARKKRKVMSVRSEEEEECQPASSHIASAELSEEDGKDALYPKQETAMIGDPTLNEGSSASSPEGDEDGDSADSDSSSDVPGAETCAICLGHMRGEVGSPESCDHTFCLICILEWAKTNASCPQDRKGFSKVLVHVNLGAEAVERVVVVKKEESELLLLPEADNPTYCEVCHECDREERLLLCDGCDLGYHLECLDPPLIEVPIEEWFCPVCVDANIPSTIGVQQAPQEGESSASQMGPCRQQSSSQRPRLIPRTRATERVRERVIKKRKEKRKKRKLNRKRRIESGELDDPRPPIEYKERLMFFGNLDTDIPPEDANDKFADQLLASGSGWSCTRNPLVRKADAARILRDSAFTPLSSYVGKTSSAVMNRVNIQAEETREDDVLSSILENQSIVLSNSKKLSLTSDRRLKKEGEGSDVESFRLEQEETSLMSEPLPSQKPLPKDGASSRNTSQVDNRRCSPSRGRSYFHSCHHSPNFCNSSYGYPSQGCKLNHRMEREERIQREERLSGKVHHSPLEDRRRSPPRLSYQRHGPYRYRNRRDFHPDHRTSDRHSYRDEKKRYQKNPPSKDSGQGQKQSIDLHWDCRQAETSNNSSRELTSQKKNEKNGKESNKESFDFRPCRHPSYKRVSGPDLSTCDKYSRRNEHSEKHSRREDDRARKEGGVHHHHHKNRSDHRSYRFSYRTDRESPASQSSQRLRSSSRSPFRSKSPDKCRLPSRSKSPPRLKVSSSCELHIQRQESTERTMQPDNGSQQENERDHLGFDTISDVKLSPHLSKSQEYAQTLPFEMFHDPAKKERALEGKTGSLKSNVNGDGIEPPENCSKPYKAIVNEWIIKKDMTDTYFYSHAVEQKVVPKVINFKKEEVISSNEDRVLMNENTVNVTRFHTPVNLLGDTKRGDIVLTSCKEEHKNGEPQKDIKARDSMRNRNVHDTHPSHSDNSSKERDNKQLNIDTDCTMQEASLERKKKKRMIPGIIGRVLEYTPEVELSHWDDEDSPTNFPSPFKVIKRRDQNDSDKSVTLPLSLQRLLPGSNSILKEFEDKKKAYKEKSKHQADPSSTVQKGRDSLCNEFQWSNTGGHGTLRPDKRDAKSILKKEERKSANASHKRSTESPEPLKVDHQLHYNGPKNVSPPASHSSSLHGTTQKGSQLSTTKKSHTLIFQKAENSINSNGKQKRDEKAQISNLATRTPQEQSHKKGSEGNVNSDNDLFGDISDISDSDSHHDENFENIVKESYEETFPRIKKYPLEKKDKYEHETKNRDGLNYNDKKIVKCDPMLKKSLKQENYLLRVLTPSPYRGTMKAKIPRKTTKNAFNKNHVMHLFGSASDSDDPVSPEVRAKEISAQKMQKKQHKSSPLKDNFFLRKTREGASSTKRNEKKCEQEIILDKKAPEELSRSGSMLRTGNEIIYTEKDKNYKCKVSLHESSSEEQAESSSESPKTGKHSHKGSIEATYSHKRKDDQESSHKITSETFTDPTVSEPSIGISSHKNLKNSSDTYGEKTKRCETEISPHKKSSDATQVEIDIKKRREATDRHNDQNSNLQEELRKPLENSSKATASEHHDNGFDHRKTDAANTHNEKRPKDKTGTQDTTEDFSKNEIVGHVDKKGKIHINRERRPSTEEKIVREKDSTSKMESKQPVALSLDLINHTSDFREKKDVVDTYAKQLKASLESKVVAEVKKWLDPHYRDKNITKDEYKEIVAKCVKKVVPAECGDIIESEKMRSLVEGYVKLYRHRRAKQQPPLSS